MRAMNRYDLYGMAMVLPVACLALLFNAVPAYAAVPNLMQEQAVTIISGRLMAAAIAFGLAALAAGWALSKIGPAALSATAERPEVSTTGIIIAALAEALGIYGLVIAIFLMGQAEILTA